MRTILFLCLGCSFAAAAFGDVVISEIMYHPASENPGEEFIELYNPGSAEQPIGGWQFTSGVKFTLPAGATIPPQGYLVVAADAAAFSAKYPDVTNVVGGWTGTLSNSSNKITLRDAAGLQQDEVDYSDDGDWAERRRQDPSDHGHRGWVWQSDADGGGKSLELIQAAFDNSTGQNWAASTVIGGTPGQANSVAAANLAPVIEKVEHFPFVPKSAENVTITCRVRDDFSGPVTVKLWSRLDGAPAFAEAPMRDDGTLGDALANDGLFTAVLPPQASGTVVEFYVAAADAAATARTWPAAARDYTGELVQTQNCLYLVDDTVVAGSLPLYRMVLRAADRTELSNINTNSGTRPFPFNPGEQTSQTWSHSRFNATFISRDGTGAQLRYLVGVRNRGNGSRNLSPQSFNVQFPNANKWNGRSAIALNTQNTPWQLFGSALYRKAGLVGPESRAVRLRMNTTNPASATGAPAYGFYVCNEAFDSDFTDHHFPLDSGGNLYRSQRLFEGTTAGGTVISNGGDLRLHVPAPDETLSQVDLYKLNYRKQTNNAEDNWSDLIGLTEALAKGVSGAAPGDPITYAPDYLESVQAVADVAQFVRWFAVQTFADNEETNLSNGDGDDYFVYLGRNDPRARLLPYDLDTILGRSGTSNLATHGIFRMVDDKRSTPRPTPMNAFIKHPEIAPLYYGELKRLLDGAFNPVEFDPFCDAVLAGVAPASVLTTIKSFNAARHAHIASLVPLQLTATSTLPVVNGLPQSTTGVASLSGLSNSIRTRSVKVNGLPATWTAWTARWSATGVPLKPGVNRVLIQAFDADDAEIDRTFFDVWFEDGTTQAVSGTLASNQTWTAAGGPYHVTATLTIPTGVTLTIEPGTSVHIAPGVTMTVNGRILAEGTETQRIRFGPAPGAGNWGRIAITNTTVESRIAYAHITGNGSSAIRLTNAIAVLDNLTFGNTGVKYLDLDASSFVVSNCVFPTPTAAFEPVHGSGAPMAGGRAIIRDCFFGRAQGYNDVIDFTGGNRPGPILQIINNVFIGSDDDILDLDGTDTWIEGNFFMDVRRFNSPDSASAISGGNDSTRISDITIIGNLFYNMDQALTAKQGNFYTMLSNTVVDQNGRGSEDTVTAVVNLADDGTTAGTGVYLEGNIIHSAEALMRHYDPALSTVTLVNNILPAPWNGPGTGNQVIDPLLNDPWTIPTPTEGSWRQTFQEIRWKFGLQARSPGIGTGPNGTDLGGIRPFGVSVSGAPIGITSDTSAILTVGTLMTGNGIPATANAFPEGSGWTHYKWRLDGGAWSAPTAIGNALVLTNLANGNHTVEVIGRNDAGTDQNDPDFGPAAAPTSVSWTVDSTYVPVVGEPQVRINEVLALNTVTVNFGSAFPDIIELHNAGGAPAPIGGWGLTDNSSSPFKYTFPAATTIPPGGYLVVYASGSGSVPQPKTGFGLKREGDTLTLTRSAAAGGGIADRVPFGYQLADHSIGRARDGSWALCHPTFGAANLLAATAPLASVKINEWLADAVTSHSTDFIELMNTAARPVDIGLCYFSDNPVARPDRFQIRQLTFIPPAGYLVFKADDDEGQGPDHTNFKLESVQGEIGLFSPSFGFVDNVVYGPQTTDVSQGRTPNGSNTIGTFAVPTPGGPNLSILPTTTLVTMNLMGANHGWRYFVAPSSAPPADSEGDLFHQVEYDDTAWVPTGSTAPQLFYIETSSLANSEGFVKTTLLPGITTVQPYQTYYFRTRFNYTGPLANVNLVAKIMVDDGALVYLNGTEVARLRLPTGEITQATRATSTVGNAVVQTIVIPASALVAGENVLAVSVHQENNQAGTSVSSDIVWGMKLDAEVTFGGALVLNEVLASNTALPNPGGGFAGWVEIRNLGPSAADLSDMSLSNNIAQPRRYVFPPGTMLAADEALIVQCDGSLPASATNSGFGLTASGGVIALYHTTARGGGLHDSIAYGRQIPNFSIGRMPDGSGAWTLCVPTRGEDNVAAALGSLTNVRLNEWLAAPITGSDFLELFNTGEEPVALGGAYLTDDLTDRTKHLVPALSYIGGAGTSRWQRWIADGNNAGLPEHVNFELSSAGEAVALYSSEGYAVDLVGFGTQAIGRSGGRYPDGTSAVLVLLPTAGAANQLHPAADSDSDGMPDVWEVANGLDPADPSDALGDADGDGQSNAAEYAAGTNPHSASSVLAAALMASGDHFAIRFTAVAGKTYTVQFKDDLTDLYWQKLANVPAAGTSSEVQVEDPTSNSRTHRFYRIVTPAVP